jgi:RNA polymerase sigma-70 factor (ECF subfamily)
MILTDEQILDLYWQRNEDALACTDHVYGQKLNALAFRILSRQEDAEETVNDTYWKAWQVIPPQRPSYFYAFLAKICRHLAFGRLDWAQAAKRNAEIVSLSNELENCIPDRMYRVDLSGEEIGHLMNEFLAETPKESRVIFLRRYWYGDTVKEIALRYRISESKVKVSLHRTRNKLRTYLEKEGISV